MIKSVDGNVLLYDGSPRVGEYAYADRIYEPPDYYGDTQMINDHFLNRPDFNLIKQNENMYMTRSPYMLDKHDGTYRSDFDINKPAFLGNFLGNTEDDLWNYIIEDESDVVSEQDLQNSEESLFQKGINIYNAMPDSVKQKASEAVLNEIDKAMNNTAQVSNSNQGGYESFMQAFKKGLVDVTGSPLQSISPSVQGQSGKIWIDPNQLTLEQLSQYIQWLENTKALSFRFNIPAITPALKALQEKYKDVDITPSWAFLQKFLAENNSMLLKESYGNGSRYWSMNRYLALFAVDNKNAILSSVTSNGSTGSGLFKSTPIIVGLLVGIGSYLL